MDLKQFKEELKEKILGFEVTKYLLESGTTRSDKQKEKMVNDSYERLEKWILEQLNPMIENPIVEATIDPEDTTISMDF